MPLRIICTWSVEPGRRRIDAAAHVEPLHDHRAVESPGVDRPVDDHPRLVRGAFRRRDRPATVGRQRRGARVGRGGARQEVLVLLVADAAQLEARGAGQVDARPAGHGAGDRRRAGRLPVSETDVVAVVCVELADAHKRRAHTQAEERHPHTDQAPGPPRPPLASPRPPCPRQAGAAWMAESAKHGFTCQRTSGDSSRCPGTPAGLYLWPGHRHPPRHSGG